MKFDVRNKKTPQRFANMRFIFYRNIKKHSVFLFVAPNIYFAYIFA